MMSICLILLCLLPLSYSARIDFKRIPTLHGLHRPPNRFFLDDPGVAKRATRDGRSVDLKNVDDVVYVANVTVGGQGYVLQLDSGSSDVVVSSPVPHTTNSSIKLSITYGSGSASGIVANASVAFANQVVSNQAILLADKFDNPVTNFEAVGILGLGFPPLSNIKAEVSQAGGGWGNTFLWNVFSQSPKDPNYMTFSLSRVENGTSVDEGGFTIGELDPTYADVMSTPAIATWPVSNPSQWSILIDGYEFSDGRKVLSSNVSSVPSGNAVLLLDTGTAYVYAPQDMVTGMYGSIQGAKYDSNAGQWTLPCDQQVYFGFWIGGRRIDIHPLDLVVPVIGSDNTCMGSFLPQSAQDGFDILAGDVFLRNVYTLFDFGDFTDATNLTMGNPYVKLLPTTNISQAAIEFQKQRGGSSTLKIPTNTAVGPSLSTTPLPSSTSTISLDDLTRKVDHIQSYEPILLAVLAVNALIMLILVIIGIMLLRRRNGRGKGIPGIPGEESPSKPSFLQNPFSSMGFRGLSKADRRPRKRGRAGPAGNTISTMELTPNKDDAEEFGSNGSKISYRPVSLQNPDAAHVGSPSSETYRMSVASPRLRNESMSMSLMPPSPMAPGADSGSPTPRPGPRGGYDVPPGFRQSTVSFRTDPYRDSAVL